MTRLAILVRRIGPYHVARLRALAQRLGKQKVTAIEVHGCGGVYPWEEIPVEQAFEQCRLFNDAQEATAVSLLWKRIESFLDAIAPSVVAVPGWADPAALAAMAHCRRRGIPVVMLSDSTAADASRHWWREAVKRQIVTFAAAALVAGQPHVAYAVALGLPPERVFTAYDVVDNAHFANGAASARTRAEALRRSLGLPDRYFLACSRFVEKKNLSRLLDAYALYRRTAGHSAWGLVLLGDGPLRPLLEQRVETLGLRDCVFMPGFKQYDELPAYYGLANAFVHASVVDQWGLVVNEAMAAGLPVIVSTRCGCSPDLVEPGYNGLRFDPLDTAALASCLVEMVSDRCDRPAMGAASEAIIRDWTPERHADALLRAVDVARSMPRKRVAPGGRMLLRALAFRVH